jgi:hypothetical protein
MQKASALLPIDPLHDIDLQYGKFNRTTALDLSKAFDNFKENAPSEHLCVFFHGGLVSEADGLSTAGRLIKATPTAAPTRSSLSGSPISSLQ